MDILCVDMDIDDSYSIKSRGPHFISKFFNEGP
jgi:hypothetical protein